MKKILITGNSGYIGSHLTSLLSNFYEVHGLDIKEPKIPVSKFYKQDIRTLMNGVLTEEYHAVVHLAALVNVGESEKDPYAYYLTNIIGTINLMNCVTSNNVIFASTGAAEAGMSAYGRSKRVAEDCVCQIANLRHMNYTTFRFYNVIGSTIAAPTNMDGLFYNLIKAMETGKFTIFGNDYQESPDGTCVRDYVHVMEICEAIREAISKPSNSTESLGHGVGYTVEHIVEKFKELNNVNFGIDYGPRRPGDIPVSVLEDVSSYMKELYTIDDLLKVDTNRKLL
jgi:UDP-glucose 4-epimerase